MASWRKATLLGFLVWLIPFTVSFIAFPLKETWRSLFESIMPVTVSIVVVACAAIYLRRVDKPSFKDGGRLGLLWFTICVVIDLPLMLNPPINYTLLEYAADIGLTYVMIPVITVGMALDASDRPEKIAA